MDRFSFRRDFGYWSRTCCCSDKTNAKTTFFGHAFPICRILSRMFSSNLTNRCHNSRWRNDLDLSFASIQLDGANKHSRRFRLGFLNDCILKREERTDFNDRLHRNCIFFLGRYLFILNELFLDLVHGSNYAYDGKFNCRTLRDETETS